MRAKKNLLAGIIVASAALALAWWLEITEKGSPRAGENNTSVKKSPQIPFEPRKPAASREQKAAMEFKTPFTMVSLSEEHARKPTAEEWQELSRILLFADPGDLVEAVKARFSVHAGTKELSALVEAYADPINDDTRQRIIEIFSTLQSADFPEVARRLLNDGNRPITDPLVCASALSLVRLGQAEDIQSIYQRINAAGDDPEPEGAMYSDADGLMYAISEARSPGLEPILIEAASGRGIATTGRARFIAAAALGNYRSVAVKEVLYNLSKNETNAQVRKQAERSLNEIQSPE